MSKYAHRLRYTDKERVFRIMLGEKEISNKQEREEWEAAYFALCLLLPRDFFLKIADVYGGIDVVNGNDKIQEAIARLFNVEKKLVKLRIKCLIDDMKQNNQKEKKKIINRKNKK